MKRFLSFVLAAISTIACTQREIEEVRLSPDGDKIFASIASTETKVQLNTWDYSTGETKYIVLSEYSRFTLTLSTTGTGEYGNSVDVFFVLKNGETTNRWWGGLWGSNSSAMDRTLDIAKTI